MNNADMANNNDDHDRLPENADLNLHQELTPDERLDALLTSPGLSTEQAVEGMQQLYKENQATFPHVVVATYTTETKDGPYISTFYTGPFENRRAAERWATAEHVGKGTADDLHISWTAERISTPEMLEQSRAEFEKFQADGGLGSVFGERD